MNLMEISLLGERSIKLRGKKISLVVNPKENSPKFLSDVLVFYRKSDVFFSQDVKLVIDGAGEYEIGGVKLSGNAVDGDIFYTIILDGITLLFAKTSTLSKLKELPDECDIVLLESDASLPQAVATALSPNVMLLYGEFAAKDAKDLGSESSSISKYSVTRDKLPEETQIVVLQ